MSEEDNIKFVYDKIPNLDEKSIIDSYLEFRKRFGSFDKFLEEAQTCISYPFLSKDEVLFRNYATCVFFKMSSTEVYKKLYKCLKEKKHQVFCQKEYLHTKELAEETLSIMSNLEPNVMNNFALAQQNCSNVREKEVYGLVFQKSIKGHPKMKEYEDKIKKLEKESSDCLKNYFCKVEAQKFENCIEDCEQKREIYEKCMKRNKFGMELLNFKPNTLNDN